MKRLFLVIPLIAAFSCIGCAATANRLNRLSLGMNKSEVIQDIGEPHTTSANDDVEFLVYFLAPRRGFQPVPYFVKLVRGDVQSFGKVGDFGTTLPERQSVDMNVTQNIGH